MATVNVTDSAYGAVGDGTTDDTSAIQSAIDDCSPGDTLYFPDGSNGASTGTYMVDSSSLGPIFKFGSTENGLTITGDDPATTAIKVFADVAEGFDIFRFAEGVDHTGTKIVDITLDGNGQNQSNIGNASIAWINEPTGTTVADDFVIQNVQILDSFVNGFICECPVKFTRCSFIDNGVGTHAAQGGNGHAFTCEFFQRSNPIEVYDCEFVNNSGSWAANSDASLTHFERCWGTFRSRVAKISGSAVSHTFRNVYAEAVMTDQESIAFGTTPTNSVDVGTIELQDVHVFRSDKSIVAFGNKSGTLKGDNIRFEDLNDSAWADGGVLNIYPDSGQTFNIDLGSVSANNIVDTSDSTGKLCNFEDSTNGFTGDVTGTIDDLTYDGCQGAGDTAQVSVTSSQVGNPISVDTPTQSEVGINSASTAGLSGVARPNLGWATDSAGWATATSITSSVTVVDDFEDAGLDNWTNDNGTAWGQESTAPYNGTGHAASETNNGGMKSQSGLNAYPSAGDTFRVYFQEETGITSRIWISFGVPSGGSQYTNAYRVEINPDGTIRLEEEEAGTVSQIGSSSLSGYNSAGTWYEAEVTWATGSPGDITLTVTEDPGGAATDLGTIGPVTPTADFTGNTNIGMYKDLGSNQVYVDYWHIV